VHDDEEIINKIRESLDDLDSNVKTEKPDFMQLVKLVNDVEEKKKSAKNRQFITFIIIAVLVINLEIFAFYRSITFFAVLQALALLFIVPFTILWARKKNRQVTL
jgi:hypothetical protein